MEELIESYLFKNKKCPLPAIGVLQVMSNTAVAMYGEGKISAPVPVIKLIEPPIPADDFIEFIAAKKNITASEASALLNQYCERLQNMDAYSETKLPYSGKFYVNGDGSLVFKTMELPRVFLPEVASERVIHPDVAHSMVVGDKETTTTEMAAYYADTDAEAKDKWWIWAIAFTVIAAVVLFFYFNSGSATGNFGNTQQIKIPAIVNTYIIAE